MGVPALKAMGKTEHLFFSEPYLKMVKFLLNQIAINAFHQLIFL
jgi:hypothetical protein